MIFRNQYNILIYDQETFLVIINVVLHNISMETVIHLIFQDSQMKHFHLFETEILCNIKNVFIVTFQSTLCILD